MYIHVINISVLRITKKLIKTTYSFKIHNTLMFNKVYWILITLLNTKVKIIYQIIFLTMKDWELHYKEQKYYKFQKLK